MDRPARLCCRRYTVRYWVALPCTSMAVSTSSTSGEARRMCSRITPPQGSPHVVVMMTPPEGARAMRPMLGPAKRGGCASQRLRLCLGDCA
jgi:hypothetical protein